VFERYQRLAERALADEPPSEAESLWILDGGDVALLPLLHAAFAPRETTAAIGALAVWYANKDRGVPVVAVIVGSLYVFWTFIANRTRFGRHVYAVGGSAEAARRAGINVDRVRIAVFMIAGFMAGVGGIILASRLRSVDPGTGGGPLLLNAIAAAVIGGTSLFGGHGRVLSALLGAAVIGTVANGMDLLNLASGYKLVITGGVLLAAVLVDAFAKRARAASGVA